ncbi:MAG: fumarate hydratase [Bacteroides sp.]|nr:fumarate hydratase [Bacillota bacterium]MCM1393677.1 fumarate hydratase [[Eubacterium] siraeum]MCM1455224.1 fumarate hydratase [Bacteroides sp.]
MREITYNQIVDAVYGLTEACTRLTPSCSRAMQEAYDKENDKNAKFALEMLIENAKVAKERKLPVCQDTGMAVVFIRLGQEVHISGGLLQDAVNEGVRRGYVENGYRASVLDPITRINTRDNTPAVTHVTLVEGDSLKITFLPKGFGSENMSRLYMLTPSAGIEGVKNSVLDAVKQAGSKPCPPIVVGVGIGGTAEKAMLVAKEQLLREIGAPSEDETLAELERELLKDINALGIGAQGFGGDTTALAVHIGKYPTHIAALPVAVNIQCNAERLSSVAL